MPKSPNQKLKLLYLYNIFVNETDQEHPLTVNELIFKLKDNGVNAERKSIYDDIDALRLFGLNIITLREGSQTKHFAASQAFELPELRLLIDAVQASRSLTAKKTSELIDKLKNLPSRYEGAQLIKQVYTAHRPKAENESIYYSIGDIHTAIDEGLQICFNYFDWNHKKQKVYRHNKAFYQISPFALVWDDEHYYMLGYDSMAQMVKHFRVDRMANVKITDFRRDGQKELESFNPAQYTGKLFGMFGGEEQAIKLVFENRLSGAMLDRFGMDILMSPVSETHAQININAVLSQQFYGWIFGFGGGVTIASPKAARQEYASLCKKAYEGHKSVL